MVIEYTVHRMKSSEIVIELRAFLPPLGKDNLGDSKIKK